MAHGLTFDPDRLHSALDKLPAERRAAFGLGICERMHPNFVAFARGTGADPSALRAFVDLAWEVLAGRQGVDLDDAAAQCEELAPDTNESFHDLVSSALDAAVATSVLLQFLTDRQTEHIVEIAGLACDSADMYVQELESMDPQDPDLEERIRLHPLMQRELERQAADLKSLAAAGADWLAKTRDQWHGCRKSLLDIAL